MRLIFPSVLLAATLSECALHRALLTPRRKLIARSYSSVSGDSIDSMKFLSPRRRHSIIQACSGGCGKCDSREACRKTAALVDSFVHYAAQAAYEHVLCGETVIEDKPLSKVIAGETMIELSLPEYGRDYGQSVYVVEAEDQAEGVQLTVETARPAGTLLPVRHVVQARRMQSDRRPRIVHHQEYTMELPIPVYSQSADFVKFCRYILVDGCELDAKEVDSFIMSIANELKSQGFLLEKKTKAFSASNVEVFFMSDADNNTLCAIRTPGLSDGQFWTYISLVPGLTPSVQIVNGTQNDQF